MILARCSFFVRVRIYPLSNSAGVRCTRDGGDNDTRRRGFGSNIPATHASARSATFAYAQQRSYEMPASAQNRSHETPTQRRSHAASASPSYIHMQRERPTSNAHMTCRRPSAYILRERHASDYPNLHTRPSIKAHIECAALASTHSSHAAQPSAKSDAGVHPETVTCNRGLLGWSPHGYLSQQCRPSNRA